MSNQAYANETTPYWAKASVEDEVDQLYEAVAFRSLDEPQQYQISLWDDPGVPDPLPYPESSNAGAMLKSDVKIIPPGDMTGVNSVTLNAVAANPGAATTLWINTADGHVYRDAVDLEDAGTGDVVGPVSSVNDSIARFDGITGKLLDTSLGLLDDSGNLTAVTLRMPATTATDGRILINSQEVLHTAGTTGNLFLRGAQDPRTITTGTHNVACCANAGASLTSGSNNILFGVNAGAFVGDGSDNVLFGTNSGFALNGATGRQNVGIGANTLSAIGTNAQQNIAVGYSAGSSLTTNDSLNICIGAPGTAGDNNKIRIGSVQTDSLIGGLRMQTTSSSVRLQVGTATSGGSFNTLVGNNCGKEDANATANVMMGSNIMSAGGITSGNLGSNVVIGANAMQNSTLVNNLAFNVLLGSRAGFSLTSTSGTATNNVAVGYGAGQNWVDAESDNICIGNDGTVADNGVIRIGNNVEHTSCYVSGIYQVATTNDEILTIQSDSQIGSKSKLSLRNDYNTTVVNSAGPYVITATDEVLLVQYTTTGAITLNLPAASTKRKFKIIDSGGNASTFNITIDADGADLITGAATFTINSNYGAVNLISDGVSNWYIA